MWTIQRDNNAGKGSVTCLNALSACVNKVVSDGYRECFKVTSRGLYSTSRSRYYRPEQVQIIACHRFEGQADPADNAVIYVVETSDGLKGTLIDATVTYPDSNVKQFVAEATDIRKMMDGQNQHFC